MSVLVKGMKKPTWCYELIDGEFKYCPFVDDDGNCILLLENGICNETWEDTYNKCPLVEVPEKHGRLIDGDVLWNAMSKYNDNEGAKFPFGYDDTLIHRDSVCSAIENAPTVIEAEGEL